MSDIREFTESFIKAEWRALIATHSDPDDASYEAAQKEASRFLESAPGSVVTLGFGRPLGVEPSTQLSREEAEEQFHPRPLFAIAEYDVGSPLYAAFVGSPRDESGRRFDRMLVIEERGGDPRIVGVTGVDPFAEGTPLPWEPLGGKQVPENAAIVRVLEISRPTNQHHAAEYDRLVQSSEEHGRG
jgi:hypothetical protein